MFQRCNKLYGGPADGCLRQLGAPANPGRHLIWLPIFGPYSGRCLLKYVWFPKLLGCMTGPYVDFLWHKLTQLTQQDHNWCPKCGCPSWKVNYRVHYLYSWQFKPPVCGPWCPCARPQTVLCCAHVIHCNICCSTLTQWVLKKPCYRRNIELADGVTGSIQLYKGCCALTPIFMVFQYHSRDYVYIYWWIYFRLVCLCFYNFVE